MSALAMAPCPVPLLLPSPQPLAPASRHQGHREMLCTAKSVKQLINSDN